MKVRTLLKGKDAELISVEEAASLLDASRLLAKHNIGVLLVVDKGGNPAGIISERDIVRALAEQGADAATTAVREVMTAELIVGVPDDELTYVMQVMTQKRIRHMPILDEDAFVGLVSIGDVVKAQIDLAETEIRYLQSYIAGRPTG